jgi:hypothetical protein
MVENMEDNTAIGVTGESVAAAATSETYSCCTKLRYQLGRAYNVHGNVRTVVCGRNERRDPNAL